MKSLHDTSIVRPDVKKEDIKDVDLKEVFGEYSKYLKEKYIREDGSIISKGIFESSVYKNCTGFEEKLEKYFGKEYFREVVYCLLKDIRYIPRCPICNNLNYLRDWIKGFQDFCCRNCINRYQSSDAWMTSAVEKSKETKRLNYKNEVLESLGIKRYSKDPEDGNYLLIYDYCKHHTGDQPLRIYFNTLSKILKNGRSTLCIDCNKEIYDNYVPTEDDVNKLLSESVLLFREYGAVINREELSMKFFPRERKIMDMYFENNVHGDHKDEIVSLAEKNYYFENQLTEIPVCSYPGCTNKPRYHRLKSYNLYCDCHLNAFHGQSEFERSICDFLEENGIKFEENERDVLSGKEIDIYCRKYSIGIECNGTFYHSDAKHSRYYHVNKRIQTKENGIRLYSLWSDSWENKQDVCKQYIMRWFGMADVVHHITSVSRICNERAMKLAECNYLYELTGCSDYFVAKNYGTEVGLVCVENQDDNYVKVNIIEIGNYNLKPQAYFEIAETLKKSYHKDVNVLIDYDVDDMEDIPGCLRFSGMTVDTWRWFKSGKRYSPDAFSEEDGLPKCYNSGTGIFSTDLNYIVPDEFKYELSSGDNVSPSVFEDYVTNVADDVVYSEQEKRLSTDYHILYRGLDIYVDYKCSSYFRRAYVGTSEDRDDVAYMRNKDDIELNKELDCWEIEEPKKRRYAKEHRILFLEVYSCECEDDLRKQLDILCSSVNCESVVESIDELNVEFEYYSNLKCMDDFDSYKVSQKNSIIKHFQMGEFYKNELEMYAYDPETRRKLIQNRVKYLGKKETLLTYPDMMNGFKKSGIYYSYSHFNPAWTNWFVFRYGITKIYDPFGGWGHHMLGMLTCKKVVYNDINEKVCNNVRRMVNYFGIKTVDVHCGDAAEYEPVEDVDAFFMCPPYFNTEVYDVRSFKNHTGFRQMMLSVFDIWDRSSANIFGIIIREDFEEIIRERYEVDEVFELSVGESHFTKSSSSKKYKEKFYIIFKK